MQIISCSTVSTATLVKLDGRLIEAAEDLGCNSAQVFSRVILPYANLKTVTPREGIEILGVRNIRDAYEAL